jgi:hypothetical protein
LDTALTAWGVGADHGDTLWEWWETYRSSDTRWEAALAALGEMLPAA